MYIYISYRSLYLYIQLSLYLYLNIDIDIYIYVYVYLHLCRYTHICVDIYKDLFICYVFKISYNFTFVLYFSKGQREKIDEEHYQWDVFQMVFSFSF